MIGVQRHVVTAACYSGTAYTSVKLLTPRAFMQTHMFSISVQADYGGSRCDFAAGATESQACDMPGTSDRTSIYLVSVECNLEPWMY
jgi:hypothetical protein